MLGGRHAGRPLYLVLANDERSTLGEALATDPDRVEAAVCRIVGRTFWPQGDPYWRHANELDSWNRSGRQGLPPFTALLFALSHAAERMESDGGFSHTNYYLRLAEVTGADRSRLSLHGRSTLQFWRAFSAWLATSNYSHGRPTARQLGSQKYVSLAISQAIVRAEDRQCFHHLFQKYGFTSSDEVSLDEMGQYIASWIHGPGANRRLKAAWAKPELRPRVCEVALAELSEWQGEDVDDAGRATSSGRLSLAAAVLPGFPRRRLSLAAGRKWQGEEAIELKGPGDAAYTLENSVYGGFATLSSPQGLQMPRVMSDGLALGTADGNHRLDWRARLLIPFVRSQSGPFWTEVARASIGTEHIVLVRDHPPIRREVDAVLSEVAVPGYTCSEAASLAGLPSGWLLYEGIQLLRPPLESPRHAVDLSPLAQAGGIKLEGGMAIGPGAWHRRAPPTIRFDVAGGDGHLTVHEGIDEAEDPFAIARTANGSALVDLSGVGLPTSGDIFARGTDGKSEHTASLLVRSARRPRPLDRRGLGQLAWGSIDTAMEIGPGMTGTFVIGLAVEGVVPPLPDAVPPAPAILAGDGEAEPLDLAVDEALQPPARKVIVPSAEVAATMSCAERAHHWYEVDFVPPEAPKGTPVSLECRDCGHAFLREGGARPRASSSVAAQPRQAPPPAVPASPPAARSWATGVDVDLLLDALSFMGSGSWASFEALVADKVEQPWEAAAIADGLSALGHLDLRRSRGDGRTKAWCVPPPLVGVAPNGDGILSGFRNEPMLEALRQRTSGSDGVLLLEPQPGQPVVARVTGLQPGQLEALVDGLRDPHGRQLRVVAGAPARLAAACMAMPGYSLLEKATLGRVAGAERFDFSTNRWREGQVEGPGAYRVRAGGTSYFFRDQAGQAWRGPHQAIKVLAARAAGGRLHAYDPATACLGSVIGCEPTGLLARALVACSGSLPVVSAHQSQHGAVPAAIASAVLDILYPGESS